MDANRRLKSLEMISGREAGEFNEHGVRFAITTSAISAAADYSHPTTGTFTVWEKDESASFPRPLIVTTDSDLINANVAHYMNFAIPNNTRIAVYRDYLGEWCICWADC